MKRLIRRKKRPEKKRLNVPVGTVFLSLVAIRIIFYPNVDENLWGFSSLSMASNGAIAGFENPAYKPPITNMSTIVGVASPAAGTAAEAASQRDDTFRTAAVCNKPLGVLWAQLCRTNFLQSATSILNGGKKVNVVQIGAHVGFERNDPFAKGITTFLELLPKQQKQEVVWTFVEPSPPNYKRLVENMHNHSDICAMRAVNSAVISDSLPQEEIQALAFYSISESIDPETGYDSKSGKTFPYWVTQISSFDMSRINQRVWKQRGLDVKDYIVETNVTALRYSDLMRGHVDKEDPPIFVLIDTEGFDCKIILGISNTSAYLPPYLVYEHKQCYADKQPAMDHLRRMKYTVTELDGENTFAYRNM